MDSEALKKSLLGKFVEVTADRLQAIQLGAIDLERSDGGQAGENLARELHTMKGEARMLGLAAVGQLAHACEDLLKAKRDQKVDGRTTTDLLLRACDAIGDLLEELESAKGGSEASNAIAFKLSETSGQALPPLVPVRKSPPASGARAVPRPTAPSNLAPPPAPAPAPAPVAPPPPSAPGPDEHAEKKVALDRSIRVNVEILDTLGLLAGDLLVESARNRLRGEELTELLARFARVGDALLRFHQSRMLDGVSRDALERMERDLHLLRDDTFRFVRHHVDGVNTLHGNLSVLADNVAEARLVPLATVFEAFPRAVREIGNSQNKQVDLVIDKTQVGVDRSMVSDVRDALVHLLRNAVDHGLEPTEQRRAAGKSPVGKIEIRARADGAMLHIEVQDDGRGMDPDQLRRVAVSRKVLTVHQANALSERDAIELIFRAGFSTRDEVSELSGRGVGMDVVKNKVEALSGSVSVKSTIGLGTTIGLRLPQSLALMRVLLVRLGDDVYGVPAAEVEAVARFKPDDRMEVFGTVAVMHRGRPTALVALGPLLALNGGPRFDRPPAVVVRHGEDRAALVVDGLIDEREVAVKPCGGEFLKGAPFVAGTAALEDGRIAVLLHVPDIMAEVRRMSRPAAEPTVSKRLRILLVDDSPIARATESALVKALGHIVEEAQDGEDAWAKVKRTPFDLVLTDVQMPKLDGFAFTRRMKGDPDLASIPVIILSSLASPEDRRRGLDAGADAYLIKGELGVEAIALAIDRLA